MRFFERPTDIGFQQLVAEVRGLTGREISAIRISVGLVTTFEDAWHLLRFLEALRGDAHVQLSQLITSLVRHLCRVGRQVHLVASSRRSRQTLLHCILNQDQFRMLYGACIDKSYNVLLGALSPYCLLERV